MPELLSLQYQTLPARLKQFRSHLGLSQTEFGKLIDLDQTAISAMEVGRQDMTIKTLYILIDLDCNPAWLLLAVPPMRLSQATLPVATVEVRELSQATEYVVRIAK